MSICEPRRMLWIFISLCFGLIYTIAADPANPLLFSFRWTDGKFFFGQTIVIAVVAFIAVQVYLDELYRKTIDKLK